MAYRVILFVAFLAVATLAKYNDIITTLDEDSWWGPGSASDDVDTSVREFSIEWSDELIADLRYRLKNHRKFTPTLEGLAFQDGFNDAILEPILEFWADGYDFEARLEFLNQYDQYKTNIAGLDIHFVHVKPEVDESIKVVPMIAMHGWPSSFRDYHDAIPYLTTPRDGFDFVYELIIPSLPSFGFSDPSVRSGMGVAEVAVIMHKLMQRLGYDQYYISAGDFGSIIGSVMATIYPDKILGYHTYAPYAIGNLYEARVQAYQYRPEELDERIRARVYPLAQRDALWDSESGYSHLHRTKPDTVGVGLSDSPAGLAAYILEKFSIGTNYQNRNASDGGFNSFNTVNLLDDLMVYWSSNCIATSIRYYKELNSARTAAYKIYDVPTEVPTWAIQATTKTFIYPAQFMTDKYVNLLNITYWDVGGHFFPFMEPALYADDVFNAVKAFQNFNGKTCSGIEVEL